MNKKIYKYQYGTPHGLTRENINEGSKLVSRGFNWLMGKVGNAFTSAIAASNAPSTVIADRLTHRNSKATLGKAYRANKKVVEDNAVYVSPSSHVAAWTLGSMNPKVGAEVLASDPRLLSLGIIGDLAALKYGPKAMRASGNRATVPANTQTVVYANAEPAVYTSARPALTANTRAVVPANTRAVVPVNTSRAIVPANTRAVVPVNTSRAVVPASTRAITTTSRRLSAIPPTARRSTGPAAAGAAAIGLALLGGDDSVGGNKPNNKVTVTAGENNNNRPSTQRRPKLINMPISNIDPSNIDFSAHISTPKIGIQPESNDTIQPGTYNNPDFYNRKDIRSDRASGRYTNVDEYWDYLNSGRNLNMYKLWLNIMRTGDGNLNKEAFYEIMDKYGIRGNLGQRDSRRLANLLNDLNLIGTEGTDARNAFIDSYNNAFDQQTI